VSNREKFECYAVQMSATPLSVLRNVSDTFIVWVLLSFKIKVCENHLLWC